MGPQAHGIENVAGGLYPDLGEHGLLTVLLQREPIRERLGNRLDGKRRAGIADLVYESVARRDADSKPVGIGAGEPRDVAGDIAFRKPLKAGAK